MLTRSGLFPGFQGPSKNGRKSFLGLPTSSGRSFSTQSLPSSLLKDRANPKIWVFFLRPASRAWQQPLDDSSNALQHAAHAIRFWFAVLSTNAGRNSFWTFAPFPERSFPNSRYVDLTAKHWLAGRLYISLPWFCHGSLINSHNALPHVPSQPRNALLVYDCTGDIIPQFNTIFENRVKRGYLTTFWGVEKIMASRGLHISGVPRQYLILQQSKHVSRVLLPICGQHHHAGLNRSPLGRP